GSTPSKPSSTTRRKKGAKVATGGKRLGNQGNFFQPTVLTDVPESARIMNEEPFGPVAVMLRFKETDEMLTRANKLPYGLASYAFTTDAKTATDALESGMVTINHFGIALPETPFPIWRVLAPALKRQPHALDTQLPPAPRPIRAECPRP